MVNGLTITNVIISPVLEEETRLRGIVSIELNHSILVKNLKIYDGYGGLFVAYPVDPNKIGEEDRHTFYAINPETKKYIETEIISTYEKTIKRLFGE